MLAAENIGLDCSGQLVSRRRNFILCLRRLSSFAIFFFTRNAFLYLVAVCHPPFQKGIMRNPNGHFELFQEYHHDKSQEATLVLELVGGANAGWVGGSRFSILRQSPPRWASSRLRRRGGQRLRLLGIFLDGQVAVEYNMYQTNRIRIVNG